MIWGYRDRQGVYLRNVRISTHTFIDHSQNLTLADHVFIGHHNYIEASNGLKIDEGCQITNFITITTHSSHQAIRLYGRKYISTKKVKGYHTGPVSIGRYAFVGPHSVIMPNTRIGKGSLIAAFSYVEGDFPDYSILKGNPAKVIGSTKEMDNRFLKDHPDLRSDYEAWQ
jgi:acetyltransferase-like isoleucine patch superfamily enzyme